MGVEMRRFAGRRTWPLRTSSPRQPSLRVQGAVTVSR